MKAMTHRQAQSFFAPISRTKADIPANLESAFRYAARGWPVWFQTPQKTPYAGTHGANDATTDREKLREMCRPDSVPSVRTGEVSGIVGLDIDIKGDRNGLGSLEELGITFHPETPTVHSPSGGLLLLFRWPGRSVRTTCDKIGRGLEVKGDNSWCTLPPGPSRFWDPHLGIETPLAPMPAWMVVNENKPVQLEPVSRLQGRPSDGLSRYGEGAFDAAVKAIMRAPQGAQEKTVNAEAYSLGQLVAGGEIPERLALDGLIAAARRMPSYDSGRPWNPDKLAEKIKRAVAEGKAVPRRAA
jgi:hypothetical protein